MAELISGPGGDLPVANAGGYSSSFDMQGVHGVHDI